MQVDLSKTERQKQKRQKSTCQQGQVKSTEVSQYNLIISVGTECYLNVWNISLTLKYFMWLKENHSLLPA
jgi:hypothetical protein